MSTKTFVLIIIGVSLLFGALCFYAAWNFKPVETCPEIKDSVLVKGDTVWMSPDTTYIVKWKEIPAVTDTTGKIKSSLIDSIFVSNKDAIKVKAKVEYNTETDMFDWLLNIEHKDFASHQVDTLKIYLVETVEIEVADPLWIGSAIVATIALFLSLIFGG